MEIVNTILYVVLAIVLLLIMITIHEFGHYIAGKILKFKIYEFSIGFGKALYKKTKKNGEVFALRLIPLGGYCSFGEDDPEGPDKDPDSFNNKAPWKRLIVLFMGAFFNFLSAIIFSVVLLALVGYGRVLNTGTVYNNVYYKDEATTPNLQKRITLAEILNEPGNMTAGNEPFDFVYDTIDSGEDYADGEPIMVADPNGTQMYIKEINGHSFNLLPTTGADKVLQNFKAFDVVELLVTDGEGHEWLVTMTGVAIDPDIGHDRQWNAICNAWYSVPPGDGVYHNFWGALGKSFSFAFEVAWLMLVLLGQLVTGQLGMEAIGGTVATVSIMGDTLGAAMAQGAASAVSNIAFLLTLISINLAVFNLLPVPSLDGARMVFVLIEWIRKKPINRDLEAKIHMVGIIVLFAFVIFADIYWTVTHLAVHMLL